MSAGARDRPDADLPETDRPETDRPKTDRPKTDRPDMASRGEGRAGSASGAAPPLAPPLAPARARTRALVAEDEALVAFDMEDMLLDLGFGEVVLCASYEEAEEALENGPFDLVLFDLNLDGKLTIPLVERTHASGTRVAVVSGYSSDRIALSTDAIPRLVKPCRMGDLRRMVTDQGG